MEQAPAYPPITPKGLNTPPCRSLHRLCHSGPGPPCPPGLTGCGARGGLRKCRPKILVFALYRRLDLARHEGVPYWLLVLSIP